MGEAGNNRREQTHINCDYSNRKGGEMGDFMRDSGRKVTKGGRKRRFAMETTTKLEEFCIKKLDALQRTIELGPIYIRGWGG